MENNFAVLEEEVPPSLELFGSMLSVYERLEDVAKVEEMKVSIFHLKEERKKKKSGDGAQSNEVAVASVL